MPEHANHRLLSAFAESRFGQNCRVLACRPKRGRCVSGVITLCGGRRVFLKLDPVERSLLLEREAAVLAALEANTSSRFAPRLVEFDPGQRILITTAAEGYAPLDRLLRRTLLADPTAATAAAFALASLHEQTPQLGGGASRMISFPLPPSVALTPEELAARPAGYAQLAAVLYQTRDAVEELASRWDSTRFIHGDFKADNLLIRVDPRWKQEPPVVIVDWEMAGLGNPIWDVGSFLGSILLVWIEVLAPRAISGEALAGQDANLVRRQIGYFLLTYRHLAAPIFKGDDSFAFTAFQYAGIFMLHRVAVSLDVNGFLSPTASLLLDLARNLLNRPDRAVAELLAGMPV